MTETPPARRTPPRSLQVRRARLVTPHMRRITLAGDDMAGFPAGSDVTTLAITEEVAPGVVASEQPPIASGVVA